MPNPSFEDIVSCPTQMSQIYLAEPWFSPYLCLSGDLNACSSSDLYNECHIVVPPFESVDVPSNVIGYQYARTGKSYAGIAFWADNGWRERIEVPLLSSLMKDSVYCVKMFVVNKTASGFLTSTSNLQFLITNDSVVDQNLMTYYVPSVSNPDSIIISDTISWTEISGCYKAQGGEHFLTIGDFMSNSESNVLNPSSIAAYYFIDDVSLELYNGLNCKCSTYDSLNSNNEQVFSIPNIFTPNNDGVNDIISFDIKSDKDFVIILNRWGNEILNLNINQPQWNGSTNGIQNVEGVYFYKAYIGGEIRTGFIHLMR